MIHKRTKRIEFLDDIKYSKTIVVKVGLDRYKEFELTIEDLNIKVNNNKITVATKELKQQLRELHLKYLNGELDEELKIAYSKYYNEEYSLRSKIPQSESVKKLREENKKLKQERKNEQ